MATITYSVPGVHCGHCVHAISSEVGELVGVAEVDVNLDTKTVTVTGDSLDDDAIRAAIDEAGYEVA